MIKPDTLNTKTDVTGELVFQPIDTGLDTITTQSDIPEEIMAPETLQSGSFQKGMTRLLSNHIISKSCFIFSWIVKTARESGQCSQFGRGNDGQYAEFVRRGGFD